MGVKHAVAVLKSESHGMKKKPWGPWTVSLGKKNISPWIPVTTLGVFGVGLQINQQTYTKMGNNDAKLQRYHSMTFRESQVWNPRFLAVTMGCSIKSGQCFPPANE